MLIFMTKGNYSAATELILQKAIPYITTGHQICIRMPIWAIGKTENTENPSK